MNAVLGKFKRKAPPQRPAAASRREPRLFVHGADSTGAPLPLPAPIRSVLDQICRRQLLVRLGEFPLLLATALPLLFLLQALADRAFNLPWGTRLFFLIVDLGAAGTLFHFFVMVPWREKLDLRTAALLVERTIPRLRTGLISAVELASAPPSYPGSTVLVQSLIRNISLEMQRGGIPAQAVPTTGLRQRARWMAAALVLTLGAFSVFYPKSEVLVRRIFLSEVPLPTQTLVAPMTKELVIPEGSDVELAARAVGVLPKNGILLVRYDDGRRETIHVSPRQVEPGVFSVNLVNVRQAFHYQFQLNDGTGPEFRVEIRVLPSLSLARFTQVYPAYTGLKETEMSSGNLNLLSGGKLRIEAESTQPLKAATLELQGLGRKIPMDITGADKRSLKKEITIPDEDLTALSIHLDGTSGESSSNDPVYQVELVRDKAPTVALTLPKNEKITVLADSRPTLAYSIRDDFGIKDIFLVYEVFRTGADGKPELAEQGRLPLGEPTVQTSIKNTMVWDLSKLIPPLVSGSSVSYWIEARDNNALLGSAIGASMKKSMEVVTEEAKKKELIDELEKRATDIKRLYDIQRTVNEKTDSTIRSNQDNKP